MPQQKDLSSIQKLYRIFTPRERLQAGLLFLASLVTAFAQAFGVFSVFPFINVVMDPAVIQENQWLSLAYEKGNFTDTNPFILILGIGVFCAVVFSNLFSAFTIWAKTKFVLGKNHTLSKRLLTVYLSKPYEYFLQRNSSDLGKNILAEINQLTSKYLMSIFEVLINTLIMIFIVVMLLLVDPVITLGALTFLGGTYLLLNVIIKRKLKKSGEARLIANQGRFRKANEALSSIKTTKVMGVESFFIKDYSKHSKKFSDYNIFANVAGKLPHYLMETIAFGGIVFFIVFQILRGNQMTTLIPIVSLFAFAGKRILPALQKVYVSVTQIYYNQPILDKIYQDMMEEATEAPIENKTEATESPLAFNQHIQLKNIQFCYADTCANVINGINLTIPKNTVVGFVGATGSGKTTLVDIIMGLLPPREGQMLLDETPITSHNLTAWQQKIGYVPQEIYLSDDTIRSNIAFGVPEREIDDQQVQLAARIAALDDFIQFQLPQKYDTIIGERGVRLSGGQRQRIGLARAIYRNPEVLVLDEATSSLDGTTEEAVLKAIGSASRARTVIMIAHRLNTLKDCDQIYIMEQGKIISQGTYDELIHENKTFMQMAKVAES